MKAGDGRSDRQLLSFVTGGQGRSVHPPPIFSLSIIPIHTFQALRTNLNRGKDLECQEIRLVHAAVVQVSKPV